MLLEESTIAVSGFGVRGKSEHVTETALWDGSVRQQIAEAVQVIVICGEHTEEGPPSVCAELCVACEERTPYFLL